jgi:hypothetical protein
VYNPVNPANPCLPTGRHSILVKKWLQWRTVALLIEWTVYMRKIKFTSLRPSYNCQQ